MEREIVVYIDLASKPILIGKLYTRVRGDKQSASFIYDKGWRERSDSFSLDPALQVGEGVFHTGGDKPLFGAIGDSAPDRWGRALMRRAERRRAKAKKETPRTLFEIDYLLGVSDGSRQGALRFKDNVDGPFLNAGDAQIPPLVKLPELLSASEKVGDDKESAEELKLLLAPGSSLGGARPKASVLGKKDKLCIAKFPHRDDEIDLVRWEAVALTLAKKAGIKIPEFSVEQVGRKRALVLTRFDREAGNPLSRIPYLSAMSMLGTSDNKEHSYIEIADAIRMVSNEPKEDMHALWRRMVFNILISNTDDHLRNHAFLYKGGSWRLSPAYDLNPTPVDISPRFHALQIGESSSEGSLELALEVAPLFELKKDEARKVARTAGRAASKWKEVAQSLGIPKGQIKRMESAFEHKDLKLAVQGSRELVR